MDCLWADFAKMRLIVLYAAKDSCDDQQNNESDTVHAKPRIGFKWEDYIQYARLIS